MIEEAIEIITKLRREDRYSFDRKTIHALRLGIQALKAVDHTRYQAPEFVIPLLPGETKE